MAEQLHQGVDADVGASELGCVSVTESIYEGAGDGLGVGAGAFERALNARLQSSLRDALAVSADEERGTRRPAGESGSCCGSPLFGVREAEGAAVEVGLDDREEFGFNGDAAFLATFAFNVDDGGAVVGSADIADIGPAKFLGSETSQHQ